jgi:hypothetical protein
MMILGPIFIEVKNDIALLLKKLVKNIVYNYLWKYINNI